MRRGVGGRVTASGRRLLVLLTALGVFGAVHLAYVRESMTVPIHVQRNFFGVLDVSARGQEEAVMLVLRHGRTVHGVQQLSPERGRGPNTYYLPESGIGQALNGHARRRYGSLRIGVVGLGAGTIAAYGRAGDYLRFYEINPAVARLSQSERPLFTYLRDSPAQIDVVLGDARAVLARERDANHRQHFDVLVLDAFNSGSIPVHLLTREALALYLEHLEPRHGILALHISNRYLDLLPVVHGLAEHYGLATTLVQRDGPGEFASSWALLARRVAALPVVPTPPPARTVLWTDDYSNLLAVLRREPSRERTPETPAALEAEAVLLDPAR